MSLAAEPETAVFSLQLDCSEQVKFPKFPLTSNVFDVSAVVPGVSEAALTQNLTVSIASEQIPAHRSLPAAAPRCRYEKQSHWFLRQSSRFFISVRLEFPPFGRAENSGSIAWLAANVAFDSRRSSYHVREYTAARSVFPLVLLIPMIFSGT